MGRLVWDSIAEKEDACFMRFFVGVLLLFGLGFGWMVGWCSVYWYMCLRCPTYSKFILFSFMEYRIRYLPVLSE
jgi:hypothetical protein